MAFRGCPPFSDTQAVVDHLTGLVKSDTTAYVKLYDGLFSEGWENNTHCEERLTQKKKILELYSARAVADETIQSGMKVAQDFRKYSVYVAKLDQEQKEREEQLDRASKEKRHRVVRNVMSAEGFGNKEISAVQAYLDSMKKIATKNTMKALRQFFDLFNEEFLFPSRDVGAYKFALATCKALKQVLVGDEDFLYEINFIMNVASESSLETYRPVVKHVITLVKEAKELKDNLSDTGSISRARDRRSLQVKPSKDPQMLSSTENVASRERDIRRRSYPCDERGKGEITCEVCRKVYKRRSCAIKHMEKCKRARNADSGRKA